MLVEGFRAVCTDIWGGWRRNVVHFLVMGRHLPQKTEPGVPKTLLLMIFVISILQESIEVQMIIWLFGHYSTRRQV